MKQKIILVLSLLYITSAMAQTTNYIHGTGKSYPSNGVATFDYTPIEDFSEMPTENLPPQPYGQADYPFSHYNDGTIIQQKSISPVIGRNFGANNLGPSLSGYNQTPSDNFMAISNDGNILSVDNYAIDYYKDTPDTIKQFTNKWETFFCVFWFFIKC